MDYATLVNSGCLGKRGQKLRVDFVDRSVGIDGPEQITIAVEFDERCGPRAVYVKTIANRFFVIVLALYQFAARLRASIKLILGREVHV